MLIRNNVIVETVVHYGALNAYFCILVLIAVQLLICLLDTLLLILDGVLDILLKAIELSRDLEIQVFYVLS